MTPLGPHCLFLDSFQYRPHQFRLSVSPIHSANLVKTNVVSMDNLLKVTWPLKHLSRWVFSSTRKAARARPTNQKPAVRHPPKEPNRQPGKRVAKLAEAVNGP